MSAEPASPDQPPAITPVLQRLRISYLTALGLIALLSFLANGTAHLMLSSQASDAPTINIAGRQRMLSQRIAKCALGIAEGQPLQPELQSALAEFEAAQRSLTEGDPALGLVPPDTPALITAYRKVDTSFDAIVRAATPLAHDARSPERARARARQVLAHEQVFLPQMHRIVDLHEAQAQQRVYRLALLEAALLGITLLVLLAEALLIFRPGLRMVYDALQRRIAAEAKLEEALALATSATEAKSAFLANMSHELRTPLHGVIGTSSLLTASELDDQQREHVRTIQSSAAFLLQLIDQVLDLSRIEAHKLQLQQQEFSFGQMVRDAMGTVEHTAEDKGLSLHVELAPEVPSQVTSDPLRLRQILTNLLFNAIKFTDTGSVAVHVSMPLPGIVRFEVRDTGIGISEAQQSVLFRPFEQADGSSTRRFGGSGLGLAISKRLVEELQGTIGVHSTLDRGSTFWFEVPTSTAPAVPEPRDPFEPLCETPPLSILLVEDNPVNQRVGEAMLESLGHTVRVAHNGLEAVNTLQDQSFDVVFMDVQMPVMDGLEATREIRQLQGPMRDVTIVGVTASALEHERQACLDQGMNRVLTKPFTRETIQRALCLES